MYMLSTVGESGQPCQTPLLTFISCVSVVSSLIFILLFSCIFIFAVKKWMRNISVLYYCK